MTRDLTWRGLGSYSFLCTYLQCVFFIRLPGPNKQQKMQTKHTAYGYDNWDIPGLRKASKFDENFVKINRIWGHKQLTRKSS